MFILTSLGVCSFSMNRVYCTLHISRALDIYLLYIHIYIYNYNLFHLLTVCVCVYIYIYIYRALFCNEIETNEMGGACGAYGGWERCAQGSDW